MPKCPFSMSEARPRPPVSPARGQKALKHLVRSADIHSFAERNYLLGSVYYHSEVDFILSFAFQLRGINKHIISLESAQIIVMAVLKKSGDIIPSAIGKRDFEAIPCLSGENQGI